MFSVSDWLNEIVDSCGRRGCMADILLPCDDLEVAEEEKQKMIAEEEAA